MSVGKDGRFEFAGYHYTDDKRTRSAVQCSAEEQAHRVGTSIGQVDGESSMNSRDELESKNKAANVYRCKQKRDAVCRDAHDQTVGPEVIERRV